MPKNNNNLITISFVVSFLSNGFSMTWNEDTSFFQVVTTKYLKNSVHFNFSSLVDILVKQILYAVGMIYRLETLDTNPNFMSMPTKYVKAHFWK